MQRHSRLVSWQGISLLETMIALIIVVVGLFALQRVFPQAVAFGREATARSQATLLAQGQLERLRLRGFEALATAEKVATPMPFVDSQQQTTAEAFRWQADVYPITKDLLELHVRVTWPWPAQTHQVHFATYISKP